ncbi:hypothetical protein JST97_02725 [bacterium]|nr:hypothetical protein [bacterium]
MLIDAGLLPYWSDSQEPTQDPVPVECRDLEIVGIDARRAGLEFDRQPHPLYLYDMPDVEGMIRLFSDFCASRNLQASCRPLTHRVSHRQRVNISLEDGPVAIVQYVGMWAVAVRVAPGRAITVLGERMPPGEFNGRWRRFVIEVQEGEKLSEQRLDGVMVDNARLLFGDAGSLALNSVELETSWGDGIFPVVADLGSEGRVLRLSVELGDEERQVRLRELMESSVDPGDLKYDDAGWHGVGDFPEECPPEFAGTHIALFLRWCLCKGWSGPLLEDQSLVKKVASGEFPATEFLFRYCDGKLLEGMLNVAGNAFASQYYGDEGLYLEDYAREFGELMYCAPDHAHDFAKFSRMLEHRLQKGPLTKPVVATGKVELSGWGTTKQVTPAPKKPAKPWWKFW